VIAPERGAKFEGTFEGGELVFRINQIATAVIPKSVRIRKAKCKEGKTISDLLAFDPPPSYPIEDGSFSIVIGDQLSWSGMFTTPKQARGTIRMFLKSEGINCTIGPVGWIAYAP
jgi:hypothetical protein